LPKSNRNRGIASYSPASSKDGKPFFLWLSPTRMHVVTHLSPKYEAMRTPDNNWTVPEAGMAQIDDIVGSVMK
jgi:arylsulfatase